MLRETITGAALAAALAFPAAARDDGRFADSSLKKWFEGLHSDRGSCCSFADGISVADVDWDTEGDHYRVRVCATAPEPGETWATCKKKAWIVVPDLSVVTEPNKLGPAVVWPYTPGGATLIRCFMPGTLS